MKITQVTPGLIRIPPNGWGAIEKIIWAYKQDLEKLGNECDIKFLNEVSICDIVHIHVANLAIEAKNKNIPYIFSLHDHHVVRYGKNSIVYKENLEAIKGSIISFTHAEFLVDYFDDTDKLFYISHGVDTEFFKPKELYRSETKLLCIANNGFADDQSFDRKGFRFAIEAAKELNLPITIAGPENNRNFFNSNPDLFEYDKLNVIFKNLTDEEILELYQSHSIFLHPSFLEAGHPNLTLLEAIACGLPIVGTYSGMFELEGMVTIKPNTNDTIDGIKKVLNSYEEFVDKTQKTKLRYSWHVIVKRLFEIYKTCNLITKKYDSSETKKLYKDSYLNEVSSNNKVSNFDMNKTFKKLSYNDIRINYNFIDGPFVEILGKNDKTYTVVFEDGDGNEFYKTTLKCNHWARASRKYYTKWRIKIYDSESLVFDYTLDYKGKRVYIAVDSKSLGDSLAWFPYVEEFRIKHDCEVICSTFHNNLFKYSYPNIKFVTPGSTVENISGMYLIGWFDDLSKEPIAPNLIPELQKASSNILGLDFQEIKPKIDFFPKKRPIDEKYVCIATHSTSQLKYWNYPNGWQHIVDYLKEKNYKVVNLSKEPDGYMGNKNPQGIIQLKNKTLDEISNYIYHSEGFIGLSSGLSWLAWALNKKIIMISNFTSSNHEFRDNCYRVENLSVCNSCWHNPSHKFDRGDWNWCPEHKNTPRQFECSKSISPSMVISKIEESLNI